MMPAGLYREKITVERPVREDNPNGSGWQTTWVMLLETLSNVEQKLASNDVIAQQENLINPFYFNMRFRTDVTFNIGDRITWRNRFFKIHSWAWDIRRTNLTIIASADNETTDISDGV